MNEKRSLERRVDALTSQSANDRSTLRSLEEMLAEKRKTEFVTESSLQQAKVENTQLQRKVG